MEGDLWNGFKRRVSPLLYYRPIIVQEHSLPVVTWQSYSKVAVVRVVVQAMIYIVIPIFKVLFKNLHNEGMLHIAFGHYV